MKRKSLLFLLFFALMAPWAANAQSTYSWGSPSDYGGYAYNANPFGRHYGFEYRVYLYPPNTMDFSGNITQIEFLPYNTMNSNGGDFTVWMKETTLSSLNDATTFSEYRSGATEVYHTSSSPSYTANTYVGITLDTPFPHSQENYLMILVRSVANSTNGDGGTAFYYKNPDNSPALTWYGKKDGSDGDPDHLTNWGAYGVNSASLPVIRWTYTSGSGSPCPAPTLGEAQYVDEDGASFQWTENGSSQDWVLQYSTYSDFTNATSVDRHGIPALAISGLNSGTTYYVRVRSVCNPSQIIWSNVVSFTTLEACPPPTNLTITEVMPNGCRASFTPGSSEPTSWYYSITTTPDEQPGWFLSIYGLTDNSFELLNGNHYMDFEPETTYYLWVGMFCEDEWHTAGPAEFTTLEACPIPANVEVSDITYNSATVTWNGYNDFYHVQWGWPSQTSLNATFTDGIPTDWNNSSDYPWTIVDGHMQSSNGGHNNSSSIISVTKTLYDAGTIEFDAECRGEGTGSYLYDKCIFSIDGEEQFVYGNQGSGWNHYSFNVTAGDHTFTWSYTKDGSVNAEGDYFAVDNVLMISNEIYWLEDEDITVNDGHSANLTGLNPNMLYCVKVQGVCNDDDFDLLKDGGGNWSGDELGTHTDWTEPVFFTTLKLPTLTQTITLTAGTNWFSTYLNISLENLQTALRAALPDVNSGITIKAKVGNSTLRNGSWRSTNNFAWDVAKMYRIEVPADCEITLTGTPINPAEHPITILAGEATWIGFPFSESMDPADVIPDGFAVNGDQIKGKDGNFRYTNRWRPSGINALEPGLGYMYVPAQSVTEDRTLYYSSNAK